MQTVILRIFTFPYLFTQRIPIFLPAILQPSSYFVRRYSHKNHLDTSGYINRFIQAVRQRPLFPPNRFVSCAPRYPRILKNAL
jgi:hypothetical protein